MIKIGFTGDFCPWLRVEDQFKTGQWESMFDTVLPFFAANDLNVLDLECPLTTATDGITKTGPHIKAHPDTAVLLKHLHCDLVATANNHFKDYGWEGMQETYQALTKNNISWLGSGANFEEASKTFFWQKDGHHIAFINITENEWTTTFDENPGCNPIELTTVFSQIQKAKEMADFVVVIAHGGHEHYELPSPRMKKWYRFFVDAGAHAVIGHHTHIISGYEVYKEAPIFYSLGNFCFDWQGLRNLPWNKGMLVRLAFEKNKAITFELDFVSHNNEEAGVYLLTPSEKEIMLTHLEKLNAIIANEEELTQAFVKYANGWEPVMNTWIQPYKSIMASLYKRGLLPSIITKRKKLLYTNLIRCEAHRDILLHAIKDKK